MTAGMFTMRHARGAVTVDPTSAVVVPPGVAFTVRHPAGPDICVCVPGPLVDATARDEVRALPVTSELAAAIGGELRAMRRGDGDAFALGEALSRLESREVERTGSAAERALVDAFVEVLRGEFASAAFTRRARGTRRG